MKDLEYIGRQIAKIRVKRGLSQEDLAGAADVNRGYISRIENGHVAFSVLVLLRIAKALDTNPAAFFAKS
jgi:transcriptional regulator with XRE-family HTH domain